MTDLYHILGIKRTASSAQIRKAYRKLAAKFHPDANPGDDSVIEKYHAVVHAYEVLSDPVRRKQYDETGDVSRPQPIDNELMSVIAPAIVTVLQGCHSPMGPDPKRTDLVVRVRDLVKSELTQVERHMAELEKARKILGDVSGRFMIESSDDNLLQMVVESQINGVEQERERTRQRLDLLTRVMNYLKLVKYKLEPGFGVNVSDSLMRILNCQYTAMT